MLQVVTGAQERTSAILFGPITTVRTTKMPKKDKSGKKGKNDIPYHNQFNYSDIIEEFHETGRITETELDTLPCFSEYKPEYKLNSLNDDRLNDHLYVVFSTKRNETISFMRTWTGFFVKQYMMKISQTVQPYLDSKKLSLDEWLMSVKHGRRGDIILVYILSIMKGLHTCIHLKNGKTWSTLREVLVHHDELMLRCDIHLAYFGSGIFLRLVQQPHLIPDILGTIYSDNPSLLNKLVTENQHAYKIRSSSTPGIKTSASAEAGSAADMPRLERELTGTTKPCMPGTTSTEVILKTSAAACRALSGTTKPHQITDTNPLTVHSSYSAQSPATLVKQKPAYMNQGNIEIRELCINVTRLTETDITKLTAKRHTFIKPVKLMLHKLPWL